MGSYPGTRARRPRRPLHLVQADTASRMSDGLLSEAIDKAKANATGQPVGGQRPDFYGVPLAAQANARHLVILEAEARRRGLR